MMTKTEHLLEIPAILRKLSHHHLDKKELSSSHLVVVIEQVLADLFPDLLAKLEESGISLVKISNHWQLKSVASFEDLAETILSKGLRKDSIIVGMGGGSLTDLVGFTASVLLRGVSWISIPTTFLAMIDASLGGKTGLDTKYGKNLIGSFHMPINTIICAEFLSTLDPLEMESGCGELIKYALLSKEIEEQIQARKTISDIIYAAAQYKIEIVKKDFLDSKERRFLNLGHTLGHAFEAYFHLRHGTAVLWGLYWEHSIMDQNLVASKVLDLAGILGLSLAPKVDLSEFKEFWKYVIRDKKVEGAQMLELPLVNEKGQLIKVKITLNDFYQKIDLHAKKLLA
ncbi:MAG: 3-dehydroquinate synthase family protein [Pseudomonadota bacterium]